MFPNLESQQEICYLEREREREGVEKERDKYVRLG
jgi:hypothetical protein